MNNTNVTLASRTGTSKLVKARFGPGMLLQHEDLEQLNSYTRDLSRIMFKSLFGCGVVCGLVVKTNTNCGKVFVTVGSGVAIACSGDPIWVPKDETFPIDENCDPEIGDRLWVVLCGTSKCCAPRTAICGPDDEEAKSECTRERYGYEIRVVRARPECVCGCPEEDPAYDDAWDPDCKCVNPELECYVDHYAGNCGCNCDECSDCDCECVLLARLDRDGDTDNFLVDHRVRRFVRPVLMRDPQVEEERVLPNTLFRKSQTQQRVERAAMQAAEDTVRQAAENAAQEAARQAAAKIAKQVGQKAAQEIVKRVSVEQVAKEAADRVQQSQQQRAVTEPFLTPVPESAPPASEETPNLASAKAPGKARKQSKPTGTKPPDTGSTS